MTKLPRNARLALMLLGFVGLMIGFAYASVPLYQIFCKVTGYNGTTQRAAGAPVAVPAAAARIITVSFDANVDSALPWDFAPMTRSVEAKVGTMMTMKYRAHNRSDKPLVGTATFNVQPDKAGLYFNKIQCFCFTRQLLKPGEAKEMPVEFFIDPAIVDNREAADVSHITLSYTFYPAKDQGLAKTP